MRHQGQVAELGVEHQLHRVRGVVGVHHLLREYKRVVVARHLPHFMRGPFLLHVGYVGVQMFVVAQRFVDFVSTL